MDTEPVTVAGRPYVIAIVGAGPSGIYAAEALSQQTEVPVEIAVIDRLPVPFGLVRYGVAPDHESIRSIRNTLQHLERPESGSMATWQSVPILRSMSCAVASMR
jgi:2-polyprenyl-6-methoxyphenol hydroxylase-like FAD-dependent oxidoreductase